MIKPWMPHRNSGGGLVVCRTWVFLLAACSLGGCARPIMVVDARSAQIADGDVGFYAYKTALAPTDADELVFVPAAKDSLLGALTVHSPTPQTVYDFAVPGRIYVETDDVESLASSVGRVGRVPDDVTLVELGFFEKTILDGRVTALEGGSPTKGITWGTLPDRTAGRVRDALERIATFAAGYGGQAVVNLSIYRPTTSKDVVVFGRLMVYDTGGKAASGGS